MTNEVATFEDKYGETRTSLDKVRNVPTDLNGIEAFVAMSHDPACFCDICFRVRARLKRREALKGGTP